MSDNDHVGHPDGYYGNYGAVTALPDGVTWLSGSGVPTDGVAGTGAGTAGKGSKYTDTTNGNEYVNQGSMASPQWRGVFLV